MSVSLLTASLSASALALSDGDKRPMRALIPVDHLASDQNNLTVCAEGPQAWTRRLSLMRSTNPPLSATANGQHVHGVASDAGGSFSGFA